LQPLIFTHPFHSLTVPLLSAFHVRASCWHVVPHFHPTPCTLLCRTFLCPQWGPRNAAARAARCCSALCRAMLKTLVCRRASSSHFHSAHCARACACRRTCANARVVSCVSRACAAAASMHLPVTECHSNARLVITQGCCVHGLRRVANQASSTHLPHHNHGVDKFVLITSNLPRAKFSQHAEGGGVGRWRGGSPMGFRVWSMKTRGLKLKETRDRPRTCCAACAASRWWLGRAQQQPPWSPPASLEKTTTPPFLHKKLLGLSASRSGPSFPRFSGRKRSSAGKVRKPYLSL
jgi:hypothetical protein